jgi:hypothetical protein
MPIAVLNRNILRQLCDDRLGEAQVLLSNGPVEGARLGNTQISGMFIDDAYLYEILTCADCRTAPHYSNLAQTNVPNLLR